ncbi:MAG: NFYB/HAP3 family transcription factor subunit [Candidatus Altiarchaeota archaeon]
MAKKINENTGDIEDMENVEIKEKPEASEANEALEETQVISEEEEVLEEGLEREYAFPMAPIVRIMKEELDKDKMIRARVKIEMNKWLEQLCRRIARRMNRSEYTMVELSDFRTAIEPYERIDDIEIEKERIIASLEKIKYDCDSLIRDVQRKFIPMEKEEESNKKE